MPLAPTYRQIVIHSIDDRDFWTHIDHDARFEDLRNRLDAMAEAAQKFDRPPEPLASDFLAARRSNDRKRLDDLWQIYRGYLGALTVRRCRLGLDANDPDDLLLNWLWSMLNTPTWCVSAHLPGSDLPAAGKHRLDLAACEMAAVLAETREALKPWMDSVSSTLAESVVYEIDRRILTPFVEGAVDDWWGARRAAQMNNWTGVCAGSILAACESLAAQGFPRPAAKAKALDLLRLYATQAFTPSGECDEGVSYWNYGVGYACIGWSRLSFDELSRELDMKRLRELADYPGRAHLFGDTFFSANDAAMQSKAPPFFVPWLAGATGAPFLSQWQHALDVWSARNFPAICRIIDALVADPGLLVRPAPAASSEPARLLPDQQVAIFAARTKAGRRITACLSGGDNAERHNHNDLGHFMIAVDERIVIPDMGAPYYLNDFFGPKRYTYLSASSRGHCCPIIDGHEQRPGKEAHGTVLTYDPARLHLALDLTAAYPPEAGLKRWTRAMTVDAVTGAVRVDDAFSARPGAAITHILWSIERPQRLSDDAVQLGDLLVKFSAIPHALTLERIDPSEHLLRMVDWLKSVQSDGPALYRIIADHSADAAGELTLTTEFTV